MFIYSPAGGMSIEDVAKDSPDQIFKLYVDASKGLCIDDLLVAAKNLGLEDQKSQLAFFFKHVYDCFMEKDCDLIEVNPLVLTK